jgi:N-acetylglucosamine malate deacetylase 2
VSGVALVPPPPERIDHLVEGMTLLDPARERGLLVVLPHPDDEAFSSGGTIALASDAGVPVTYLCGTYGDMGRRMGSPFFATRESMRDVRERELAEACRILGARYELLGMRDRMVEFEDPHAVAARVREAIVRLTPSTVITFYPGHAIHPDHDAMGLATRLAVESLPPGSAPQLLAVAVGDRQQLRELLGPPHVAVDIRRVRGRKLDALRAHRSQTELMFLRWQAEVEEDEQTRVFREEMLTVERFYRLNGVPHGTAA